MFRRMIQNECVFILASIAALLLYCGYNITSASVDIAYHYSVVRYIYENHHIPIWKDLSQTSAIPSLGIMTFYPPLSYLIAATIGRIIGDPFFAMVSTGLTAVFLIYYCLLRSMMQDGRRSGAFLFSIAIISVGPYAAIHGWQILNNYFFAQLIGDALSLWMLYICIFLLSTWVSVIGALIFCYILSYTYLMSGIIFSASFLVYLLLHLIPNLFRSRDRWLVSITQLSAAVLSIAIVNILSPELPFMRLVAAHDGGFHPEIGPITLTVCAAVLVFISLTVAFQSIVFDSRGGKFVSALGLGTSSVFFLQTFALYLFGVGSNYSLKKYSFDIFTMVFACLAYLVQTRMPSKTAINNAPLTFSAKIVKNVVCSGLCLIVCTRIISSQPAYDFRGYLNYETYVSSLLIKNSSLSKPGATASMVDSIASPAALQATLNFATNVADLAMPAELATKLYAAGQASSLQFAFVSADNELSTQNKCVLDSKGPAETYLVDYECALAGISLVSVGETVEIHGPAKPTFLEEGWDAPGPNGVWSIGNQSVLRIPLKTKQRPASDLTLSITMYPFVSGKVSSQRVSVRIGDRTTPVIFSGGQETTPTRVFVPATSFDENGVVKVVLETPDAQSPASLGLGEDNRLLGVGLISFKLLDKEN